MKETDSLSAFVGSQFKLLESWQTGVPLTCSCTCEQDFLCLCTAQPTSVSRTVRVILEVGGAVLIRGLCLRVSNFDILLSSKGLACLMKMYADQRGRCNICTHAHYQS